MIDTLEENILGVPGDDSVDIEKPETKARVNSLLAQALEQSFITPYMAIERISNVLAKFHIPIPKTRFLEGDHGYQVFDVVQFGHKFGMTDQGEVVQKEGCSCSIYFEYQLNEEGTFDIFCEIVDEDELDDLLNDVEEEENEIRENTISEAKISKEEELAIRTAMRVLRTRVLKPSAKKVIKKAKKIAKKLPASSPIKKKLDKPLKFKFPKSKKLMEPKKAPKKKTEVKKKVKTKKVLKPKVKATSMPAPKKAKPMRPKAKKASVEKKKEIVKKATKKIAKKKVTSPKKVQSSPVKKKEAPPVVSVKKKIVKRKKSNKPKINHAEVLKKVKKRVLTPKEPIVKKAPSPKPEAPKPSTSLFKKTEFDTKSSLPTVAAKVMSYSPNEPKIPKDAFDTAWEASSKSKDHYSPKNLKSLYNLAHSEQQKAALTAKSKEDYNRLNDQFHKRKSIVASALHHYSDSAPHDEIMGHIHYGTIEPDHVILNNLHKSAKRDLVLGKTDKTTYNKRLKRINDLSLTVHGETEKNRLPGANPDTRLGRILSMIGGSKKVPMKTFKEEVVEIMNKKVI